MGKHNEFGQEGEQRAVDFLIEKGYRIKHRNYRYQKAEIDIIAQKGTVLAIVEVKSRSSNFLEHIANTINAKKIKLVVMAANHYVLQNDLDVDVRFDIITILKKDTTYTITHIENAFYHF